MHFVDSSSKMNLGMSVNDSRRFSNNFSNNLVGNNDIDLGGVTYLKRSVEYVSFSCEFLQ